MSLLHCQPPCEAVSWNWFLRRFFAGGCRQPPCEAVSWNALGNCQIYTDMVSLLVRLWVEIFLTGRIIEEHSSASLWGCELKYKCRCWHFADGGQPPCEAVSWNSVSAKHCIPTFPSASLWGCELKCKTVRTDVPWYTVSLLVRLWVEIYNDSASDIRLKSASLWGCELK